MATDDLTEHQHRSINRKYPDIALRLMLFTRPVGDCLAVWTGTVDRDGYARARVDGGPPTRLARVVWERAHGKPIPDGLVIRHTCDNPPCLDPRHLIIGTVADNNRDRAERGRSARGTRHHSNTLTEDQVRAIYERTATGESVVAVAREYGVRPWAIQKIRDGRTWRHVTQPKEQQNA